MGSWQKRSPFPRSRSGAGWRGGEKKEIGLTELRKLAKKIKRPVEAFLLKKPPKDNRPTDYRMLAGANGKRLSHKTIASIREARWLQSVAKEMMEEMEMCTRPKIGSGTTPGWPKEAARVEMERLKAAAPGRLRTAASNKFYKELRKAIESLNVLVFQAPIDVEEVRGLALSGAEPNAILVSSKDGYEARIFSLLHEYGHLLLRKGDGMCNPAADGRMGGRSDEDAERWRDPAADGRMGGRSDEDAERWCNHFAAEALMPEEEFREEIRRHEDKGMDTREIIGRLAKRFRTSKQATTIRAINMTSGKRADDYRHFLKEMPSGHTSKSSGGGGGLSAAKKCVIRKGNMFVSLVFEASEREKITTRDVINYLEISVGQIGEVWEAAG